MADKPTDDSIDEELVRLWRELNPTAQFYPESADEDMYLAEAKRRVQALLVREQASEIKKVRAVMSSEGIIGFWKHIKYRLAELEQLKGGE